MCTHGREEQRERERQSQEGRIVVGQLTPRCFCCWTTESSVHIWQEACARRRPPHTHTRTGGSLVQDLQRTRVSGGRDSVIKGESDIGCSRLPSLVAERADLACPRQHAVEACGSHRAMLLRRRTALLARARAPLGGSGESPRTCEEPPAGFLPGASAYLSENPRIRGPARTRARAPRRQHLQLSLRPCLVAWTAGRSRARARSLVPCNVRDVDSFLSESL